MIIDTIDAWQVEKGDLITLGSDTTFEVFGVEDEDTTIRLAVTDDEGTVEVFDFLADDQIILVVSLDDPEPVEVESLS